MEPSSSTSEAMKMVKLDGSNYISWKFNMKLLLMGMDLYGFIEGSEVPPVPTEDNKMEKEVKLYKSRSQKAYSLIARAVSPSLQVHVMNTVCPKKAWDTLKSHFEFVSITQIVRVNRAFFAATMKEETDLIEHLTHMTTLAQQLRELNEDISSKKFAVVVLGSLPDSYDNFMTSLNARDANTLTWEDVKSALMEEYMKRKDRVEKEEERAMFAGGNRGGGPPAHRGGSRGFRGGRGGGRIGRGGSHTPAVENPPNPPNRGNATRGGRGGRGLGRGAPFNRHQNRDCWTCGEFGHISHDCTNAPNDENANVVETRDRDEFPSESDNKRIKLADDVFLESDIALAVSSCGGDKYGNQEDWFVDSAASSHMTYDKNVLQQYFDYKIPRKVYLGNDTWIPSAGEGKIRLPILSDEQELFLALHRVVFVPELAKNLLSVKSMTNNDAKVIFDKKSCVVVPPRGESFTIAHAVDGNLYKVNISKKEHANYSSDQKNADVDINENSENDVSSQQLWHARLGHLNHKYVQQVASDELATGIKLKSSIETPDCEACTLGKMHRSSFPKKSQHRATKILELIHSDLCGPMQVNSSGGSRYMLTLTDDFSRFTHVYFLKKKSDVLEKFKEFVTLAENMCDSKVERLNIYDRVKFKKI